MSLSMPASACEAMVPPPHDWNRSGGLPDCISVASLVLNASFSNTVILIVTFGWAAVYVSAMPWKMDLPGSPVVMCHQLMVTGAGVPVGAGVALGAGVPGAGVAGAGVGDAPLDEHALAASATMATPARSRVGINFTCQPPICRETIRPGKLRTAALPSTSPESNPGRCLLNCPRSRARSRFRVAELRPPVTAVQRCIPM